MQACFMSHGKASMIIHYHAHDGVIVNQGENQETWDFKPESQMPIKGQLTHQQKEGEKSTILFMSNQFLPKDFQRNLHTLIIWTKTFMDPCSIIID